jgi:hypothetical protein
VIDAPSLLYLRHMDKSIHLALDALQVDEGAEVLDAGNLAVVDLEQHRLVVQLWGGRPAELVDVFVSVLLAASLLVVALDGPCTAKFVFEDQLLVLLWPPPTTARPRL